MEQHLVKEWRLVPKLDLSFDVVENEFTPWTIWQTPVNSSKVSLVTTGGVYLKKGLHQPFDDENMAGDPSFREFPSVVDGEDLTYSYTHIDERYLKEDLNVIFPLPHLRQMAAAGEIGAVAPFVYSFLGYCTAPVPLLSNYAPSVAYRMRRMGADVAVILAVGTVGHHTAGLVARAIELAGVSTVVLGTDRELLEKVRVPRAVVVKHPDGSPLGVPGDAARQQQLLRDVLETAWNFESAGIAELPYEWKGW